MTNEEKRKELLKMYRNRNAEQRAQLEEELEDRLEELIRETKASLESFKNTKNTNLIRNLHDRVKFVEEAITEIEKIKAKEEAMKVMDWSNEEDDE